MPLDLYNKTEIELLPPLRKETEPLQQEMSQVHILRRKPLTHVQLRKPALLLHMQDLLGARRP